MNKRTLFFWSMTVVVVLLGLAWGFMVKSWPLPVFGPALFFMFLGVLAYLGHALLEVLFDITVPLRTEGLIFLVAIMLMAGFIVLMDVWGIAIAAVMILFAFWLRNK